jgi:hypothetical protein
MAALTITANKVVPVLKNKYMTAPSGEAFVRGQYVRLDVTTGRWVLGNSSAAGEVGFGGIALSDGPVGMAVTVMLDGVLDVGDALSALNFGASVFLNDADGVLGDAAGTVPTVVGKVVPGHAATTPDKLLYVKTW